MALKKQTAMAWAADNVFYVLIHSLFATREATLALELKFQGQKSSNSRRMVRKKDI